MRRLMSILTTLLLLLNAQPATAHVGLDPHDAGPRLGGDLAFFDQAPRFPGSNPPPTPNNLGVGFADGPNLYAYVRQNPWTKFDPEGLTGYRGYWAGVGDFWKGIGEAGWGAVAGTVESIIDLPSNLITLGKATIAAVKMPQVVGSSLKETANNLKGAIVETGKNLAEGDCEVAGKLFGGAALAVVAGKVGRDLKARGSEGPEAEPRLNQDANVDPKPPLAKPTNRPISTSQSQNAEAQKMVQQMTQDGYTDVRVNQQQVNAAGDRVGINRPDVQGTNPNGIREYHEFDRSSSNRGPMHEGRIRANDPDGAVHQHESN